MTEFAIAICDDLEGERVRLARMVQAYVQSHGIPVRLQLFSSGESLLDVIQNQGEGYFQLIFLDIYLTGLSGVETARRIRTYDNSVAIIFATTSLDHGVDSFEVRASDYLVKPFQEDAVTASLDWFFAHIPEPLRVLSIYSEGEWQKIPLSSILYVDVYGHQARIHTTGGELVTRRGLDELEAAIDSRDFLRCHRSFLVNLNHVEQVVGSDFRMDDQSLVPIRSANVAQVRSQIIDWTYIKAWSQS